MSSTTAALALTEKVAMRCLWWIGLLAAIVSVVVNAIIVTIARGLFNVLQEFMPFTVPQFTFLTMDLSGHFIPAPGARRYEVGTVYWPALFGMRESLGWLEELGYDWIYEQTQTITRRCREMLAELPGLTICSPAAHAGLTAFSVKGLAAEAAINTLAEKGVIIRALSDTNWLRISTGFFNSDDDLVRLCDGLRALQ